MVTDIEVKIFRKNIVARSASWFMFWTGKLNFHWLILEVTLSKTDHLEKYLPVLFIPTVLHTSVISKWLGLFSLWFPHPFIFIYILWCSIILAHDFSAKRKKRLLDFFYTVPGRNKFSFPSSQWSINYYYYTIIITCFLCYLKTECSCLVLYVIL